MPNHCLLMFKMKFGQIKILCLTVPVRQFFPDVVILLIAQKVLEKLRLLD